MKLKQILFLVIALNASLSHAVTQSVLGILGDSIAGVAVIAFGLYAAYISTNNVYANVTEFQAAAQAYADQQVATKYANEYASHQNGTSTPTSEEYQTDYPQDWASAFETFINKSIANVSGVNWSDFNNFVSQWATSSGGSYSNGLTGISKALENGGVNTIGKWTVPDGYLNLLDYMIKNNITSPDAVKSLYEYMQAADSGNLPSTYTPGDMPPPNIPVVPEGGPIGTAGTISTGTGGQSASYVDAYNESISSYDSVAKSIGNLETYNQVLTGSYQNFQKEVATLGKEISIAQASGDADIEALKTALQAAQAKVDAAAEAYKAANNGEAIPDE